VREREARGRERQERDRQERERQEREDCDAKEFASQGKKERSKAMQKTESDTKSAEHHAATKQRVPCYNTKRNSTEKQQC